MKLGCLRTAKYDAIFAAGWGSPDGLATLRESNCDRVALLWFIFRFVLLLLHCVVWFFVPWKMQNEPYPAPSTRILLPFCSRECWKVIDGRYFSNEVFKANIWYLFISIWRKIIRVCLTLFLLSWILQRPGNPHTGLVQIWQFPKFCWLYQRTEFISNWHFGIYFQHLFKIPDLSVILISRAI